MLRRWAVLSGSVLVGYVNAVDDEFALKLAFYEFGLYNPVVVDEAVYKESLHE